MNSVLANLADFFRFTHTTTVVVNINKLINLSHDSDPPVAAEYAYQQKTCTPPGGQSPDHTEQSSLV